MGRGRSPSNSISPWPNCAKCQEFFSPGLPHLFCWCEQFELVNLAFAACPGVDQVSIFADATVFRGLHIKARVKVNRRAAPFQLGPHPRTATQQQVNCFGAGNNGRRQCTGHNAFRTLMLIPTIPFGRRGCWGHRWAHPDHTGLLDLHLRQDNRRSTSGRDEQHMGSRKSYRHTTISKYRMITPA